MQKIIYGLRDPETKEYRYVGASVDPESRYEDHVYDLSGNARLRSWLSDLFDAGREPDIVHLEHVPESVGWEEREAHWIDQLDRGNRLVNVRSYGTHAPSIRPHGDRDCSERLERPKRNGSRTICEECGAVLPHPQQEGDEE